MPQDSVGQALSSSEGLNTVSKIALTSVTSGEIFWAKFCQ
jgi:hypothetical protein